MTIQDLLDGSACIDACVPIGLVPVLEVQILLGADPSSTIQSLLADSSCLSNCVPPGQMPYLELSLLMSGLLSPTQDVRITEEGETRVTAEGDTRVTLTD